MAMTLDPYLAWAQATGFAYFPKVAGGWIPLLIRLSDEINASDFARGAWSRPHDLDDWLIVPSFYRTPPEGLADSRFCTALVTLRFFSELATDKQLSKLIAGIEFGLPLPPDPPTLTKPPASSKTPQQATRTYSRSPVVVGIIDDGIAFAHQRFRRRDGTTRVAAFWDQDGPALPAGSAVPYGSVLDRTQIDALLADATHAGLVDEDQVYRDAGYGYANSRHKALGRRSAHGTHVLDIAAGADPEDAANAPPIVCVQFPERTTRDTSGAFLKDNILDGVQFILQRAQMLADPAGTGPWPVVINVSYGMFAGPHDGSSILEEALDASIRDRVGGLDIVVPAGNNFLARCHAVLLPGQDNAIDLDWRVHPDDTTPSFVEMWMEPASYDAHPVEVQVETPAGTASPWIVPGQSWSIDVGGVVVARAQYEANVANGERTMVLVAVAPTLDLDPVRPVAPSGIWRLRVRKAGASRKVDVWVQRDDTPYGYPLRGRQSRLEDEDYEIRNLFGRPQEVDNASKIRRAGTLNAIATGKESIVVAGLLRREQAAAPYSSAGPALPRGGALHRDGPDLTAGSDDSRVLHGVLAAGARSGTVCAMDGTSVAAPRVVRWIADALANGQAVDRAAVRAFATQQEQLFPPGSQLPPERGGAGRTKLGPIARTPLPPIER